MIYFVRHGQTDWNLEKKVQGRADISLNETGILQAKQMAEKIKDVKVDKIFCSPLKRAKETCEILTDLEIMFDNRIIERDFGEFEGVKKTDFDFEGFWNSTKNQNYISAESIFDFEKRIYSFLDEITTKYENKNVLIVAHGGVGLIFQAYFCGKPLDGNYLQFLVDNGQLLCFNK